MSPPAGFWAGRSVLVTGHTGFKGAWLTLWLSRLGATVTGLSLEPQTEPSLFALAVRDCARNVFADIRDLDAVRRAVSATRPELVLHLAAQSLVRPSYADPVGTYATNVMGTVNLLQAVRETDSVSSVVVVTSDKAYENREWLWAYRENEAMGGRDPYSSSKGCAELVVGAFRDSFFKADPGRRVNVASVRAGNVIGGGDWSADRLVPDIVRSFSRGESVEIRNPHAIRPWQHVIEPLSGYLMLAQALGSGGGEGFADAWNFGPSDEDCRPVAEVVGRFAASWGRDASWHLSAGEHPHEASLLKVDSSKARTRLRWERRLGLAQALGWTAEWYRAFGDGESALDLTLAQIARYEEIGEHAS